MDLEKMKQKFKDHKATFHDYGNIKILDFKKPNSIEYRIRFIFEEDYCRLHISGDLGQLVATNYRNMCWNGFNDFVEDVGYFEEKIDCHDRHIYLYDEEQTRKDVAQYVEENDLYFEIDDRYPFKSKEEIMQIAIDGAKLVKELAKEYDGDFRFEYSPESFTGEKLLELDTDIYLETSNFGIKPTGILDLYMLAFKLAKEQLDSK